jgi:hypothetical protein
MSQRVRELPGWEVVEMPTGHFPMVTQPEALVRHVLAFAPVLRPRTNLTPARGVRDNPAHILSQATASPTCPPGQGGSRKQMGSCRH